MKTGRPETDGSLDATLDVARASDIESLVSMDADSHQPWTAEAFRAELEHDPPTLFVLRSSEDVRAFMAVRIQPPEMDIVNLVVDRNSRRRGFGGLLLSLVLDRAASMGVQTAFLEVREGNREARGLYEMVGFKETQKRRGFYSGPVEDAILMRLEIERRTRLKGPRNAC